MKMPDMTVDVLVRERKVDADGLREHRHGPYGCEFRAEGEEGSRKLTGHAAVFDELSVELWGFREKIAPGAFAETLGKDDIRALWNHDTNIVLGRNRSGTLSLKEDATGLLVVIDMPRARAAELETIERGDVTQMSFGFRVLEDSWTTADDDSDMLIRTVDKVQLFEVSPVTFPAYPQTDIDVAKRSMWAWRKARPRLRVEAYDGIWRPIFDRINSGG